MLDYVDESNRPLGEVPGDWYELCSYVDGVPREFELTAMQHGLIVALLGLEGGEPRPDEEIADVILPAIVKALKDTQGE